MAPAIPQTICIDRAAHASQRTTCPSLMHAAGQNWSSQAEYTVMRYLTPKRHLRRLHTLNCPPDSWWDSGLSMARAIVQLVTIRAAPWIHHAAGH